MSHPRRSLFKGTLATVWRWLGCHIPALVAGMCGLWIAAMVFMAVGRGDEQRVLSGLQQKSEWRTRDLEVQLHRASVPIATLVAHLSIKAADAGSFESFARRMLSSDAAMVSLEWRPRAASREPGAPTPSGGPTVVPADEFPAVHQVRADADAPAHADALWLDARMRQAAVRARDEGRPRATLPQSPAGGPPREQVIVLVWPVFQGGDAPMSMEERRARFLGFVTASYSVRALLVAAFADALSPMSNVRFFVENQEENNERTATEVASYSLSRRAVGPALETPGNAQPGDVRVNRAVTAHGQTWQVMFNYPAAVVDELRSSSQWAWLGALLLATIGIVVYLGQEGSRRSAIERLVSKRTAALTTAYRVLKQEMNERESAQRALLETAETLRALVDGSAHAIVAIAPDHKILLWNKAAEQIFGFAAQEVVGNRYPMIPASGRDAFHALLADACDGNVQKNVHFSCVRKDGTSVEVRCGGAPFYDASGTLRGIAWMLEDVTEQLATEAMLRQAQKMEAVGTLTGGLAHDFNNLLAIVMLNLENVLDLAPIGEVQESIERALSAAEKGGELTRQLLTFARKQPLRPQLLDLNDLIGKTVKLLDRALGEQVVIRFEPSAGLPRVAIDGAQLDSAIVNLSVNARDAMPGGGLLTIRSVLMTLDAAETSGPVQIPPGTYAVVEVSDTGTGMPPDVAKRVFEPFFTTKGPGRGTGLGLSMVFGFMKQSRGYTTVHSVEGRGTTFRLYLPVDDAGVLAVTDSAVADGVAEGRGEKILVVEDNVQIRKVVVSQLESLGYRPVEASTPLEALRIVNDEDGIELLFTDIVMPGGMDGFGLARAAQSRRPGLRVLTSSGFTGESAAPDRSAQEDFPLLAKPYRREALAAAVADALSPRDQQPDQVASAA